MTYISFETPQLFNIGGEPALFLFDMALKATAIILAAIALNIALRRASAATRHLLWSASLLGLLALPFLASSAAQLARGRLARVVFDLEGRFNRSRI